MSKYSDQIKRGHYNFDTENPSHFLHCLNDAAIKNYKHHTGSASTKCPSKPGARFGHIIKIEDVATFAKVARTVSIISEWKKCTGGELSLYLLGSFSAHKTIRNLKHLLCEPIPIKAVCDVYKDDYELYEKIGVPFECKCIVLVEPAVEGEDKKTTGGK